MTAAYEAVFYDIIKKLEGKINFEIDNKLFKKFSVISSELDVTEKGGKDKGDMRYSRRQEYLS